MVGAATLEALVAVLGSLLFGLGERQLLLNLGQLGGHPVQFGLHGLELVASNRTAQFCLKVAVVYFGLVQEVAEMDVVWHLLHHHRILSSQLAHKVIYLPLLE